MSKPNWKDAPEWANWLAQDEDGEWYWYEKKPRVLSNMWGEETLRGKKKVADFIRDWEGTLEERPK